MTNPMLEKLRPSQNLLSALQRSQNPKEFIESTIANNPQVNDLIQAYGNGDARTAFYSLAQAKGQDPEKIIQALKNIK